MKENVSLMYSGGLDSFIAYHYAICNGYDPICIFVNLGHPYAKKELQVLDKIPEYFRPKVNVLDLSSLYSLIEKRLQNQIIPSRNVLFAVIGSMFSSRVWINALDGEQNGKEHDKSLRFFKDTSDLLSYTNSFFQDRTIVESPFSKMSKAETIEWILDYGIPKDVLFQTSTCYDGAHLKCGKCLSCYKRKQAFLLNGIDEPGYASDPFESDYAKEVDLEMVEAIKNNDYSRFTEKRVSEWLKFKDIRKSQ